MARKSDDAFVEQVRRNLRVRRRVGYVLVPAGLLLIGFMVYLLFFKTGSVWRLVEMVISGPRPISDEDVRVRARLIFIIGIAGGVAMGNAIHLLLGGIIYFFPKRAETLLLQLWDERAAARSNQSNGS